MVLLFTIGVLSWATFTRCTEVLLVTSASFRLEPPQCLAQSFLGSYGSPSDRYSVYRSSIECATDMSIADYLDEASVIPVEDNAHIVYIQETTVEESLREKRTTFTDELDKFLARISRIPTGKDLDASNHQSIMTTTYEALVLHQTPASALVTVPSSLLPELDTLLPPLFVPVMLPATSSPFVPVPSEAVKRVSDWLVTLSFEADIAAIVGHLSVPQMQNDVRYLTGEDEASGIVSRHSFSEGAKVAATWIQARMENTGATCELRSFLPGFAPNVICRYPASVNTTATVILSAHYDSRGSFGSVRAPGGNDDGSGVISILGIARTIQSKRINFRSNVELVAFAGEEQGLLGSRAYSKELRDAGANVTLMIQADMLAYHKSDEPPQLGLPNLIGTPEAAQLLANVSAIYSPELSVGYTPACCSDHQSFHEQGFPATQVYERAGPIADPMYHNSGDLSDREGYDFEQVKSIAKVTFATLLHAAGYDIEAEASGSR